MHDFQTLRKLSDKELQDMLRTLENRISAASTLSNEQVLELLMYQKDIIISEMQERQMTSKDALHPKPINLTTDSLSQSETEKENENKFRK